jgi:hypothetical protein
MRDEGASVSASVEIHHDSLAGAEEKADAVQSGLGDTFTAVPAPVAPVEVP